MKKKRRPFTLKDYLGFLSFIFFTTGILFTVFVYLLGMFNYVGFGFIWYSDPLLYLGLGVAFFIGYIMQKKYYFFDGLCDTDKHG